MLNPESDGELNKTQNPFYLTSRNSKENPDRTKKNMKNMKDNTGQEKQILL